MKIRFCSDLHLEFAGFRMDRSDADVMVFAGDIHVGEKGVAWLKEQNLDIPIIYVLGNHEYYRNTYPKLIREMKEEAEGSNIHILENESLVVDEVTFHVCTLWTDFRLYGDPKIAGYECQMVMSDFAMIRRLPGYSKLRAIDVAQIHSKSRIWLADSLDKSSTEKNVVVTHHAPSLESAPECYRDDMVTAAFASDLTGFIGEHQPDIWIHGHMHNSSDYKIGNCRVLCNPKGYYDENEEFDQLKTIEI